MSDQQPVEVKRHRSNGHVMETRIFARRIHETFCAQKGCRFFGRHAAQGICHTRLKRPDQKYLERTERRAEEFVKEMREIRASQKMTPAQYVNYLERHMLCDWMNHEFGMDELIRLRAMNADLRLRVTPVEVCRGRSQRRKHGNPTPRD